jgi:hypothetical protein
MKRRHLILSLGMLALVGCATESSVDTSPFDPQVLKGSPAGMATLGFVDIATAIPGLLGGAFPSCASVATAGTTSTVTFNTCPSATGGTFQGTVTASDTPAGGNHAFVETYNSLADVRSSSLQWVAAGKLDVGVTTATSTATLATETGFKMTVTDTLVPANNKVWTFSCNLTAHEDGNGGYSLLGTYSFVSGTTDSVRVDITPGNPLVWHKGSTYPVSGQITLTDTRAGGTGEVITATFSSGALNINGGTITLGQ